MSLGDLTEEEVGGIRAGTLEKLTISQVLALAEAFGVHPSCFLARSKVPTLLGEREINALGDRRARAILNRSLDLSDRRRTWCWT